ncbi:MAG: hypothetical protein JXA54_11790 [Candidatus Heimdallarchaeota archaeon]|nr:hypothetical protein [Candidatus Heimdallarchaeota archaeon]
MKLEDNIEDQNQITTNKKFNNLSKCLYNIEAYLMSIFGTLISLTILLSVLHVYFQNLDPQIIKTRMLLLIIVSLSFFLAFLLNTGYIIFRIYKYKTLKKVELNRKTEEEIILQIKGIKIIRIIIWIFYGITFLALIAYIIHSIIIII